MIEVAISRFFLLAECHYCKMENDIALTHKLKFINIIPSYYIGSPKPFNKSFSCV